MTDRRIIFWIGCLAVVLLPSCGSRDAKDIREACFKDNCVYVEIALTDEERMKGLQHRKSLAGDRGMLFVFPESRQYAFWMKDTYIPLDMIWLDAERQVVTVRSNVPPCTSDPCPTYGPSNSAVYVLEVNAGVMEEWGVKVGDQAVFK